jgi:hypothetical protein
MFTMAAEHRQTCDDMVTGFDIANIGSDRFHHTGRFVPEHHRKRCGVKPLDKMQIAMTHTDGGCFYKHLTGAGLGNFNIFDG